MEILYLAVQRYSTFETSTLPRLTQSATQPFLVSSRNAPPCGEERCVTTKNGFVTDYALPYCTCSCQKKQTAKKRQVQISKITLFLDIPLPSLHDHDVNMLGSSVKLRRRQRQRKRHLKNEFVPFQTLSSLFHLVQFVNCWQIFQESDSKGLYRSSGKEKEIRYLVFTPSTKRFTSQSYSDGEEMQKKA